MSYGDIKPLPYTTYDVIVHLMSGIAFTSAVFYIFSLLEPLRKLIMKETIKDSNVDDIFFLIFFLIISYSTGHIITSVSSKLIQSSLDSDYERPFDYYFKRDLCYKKSKSNSSCPVIFLHFIFLTPLWIIKKFRNVINRTYYDDFFLEENSDEYRRLCKAIDLHWDLSNTTINSNRKKEPYIEARNFLREKLVFHYIESLSKSHPSHHSEFVYGHLIQYSFARNMAFVFSSATMMVILLLGLSYFHVKCQPFTFIDFILTRSHHIVYHDKSGWFVLFSTLGITTLISISFFLRFLDQYKRYTREIYLAFVTEELRKEKEHCTTKKPNRK